MVQPPTFRQRFRTTRPSQIAGLLLLAIAQADCSTTPSPFVRSVNVFLTSGGNVLSAGQQVQLTAEARYSDERTVDVTSAATWRSENVAVATVVGGLVTGVAGGNVNIVATFEGASGTISIAVRIPSAT